MSQTNFWICLQIISENIKDFEWTNWRYMFISITKNRCQNLLLFPFFFLFDFSFVRRRLRLYKDEAFQYYTRNMFNERKRKYYFLSMVLSLAFIESTYYFIVMILKWNFLVISYYLWQLTQVSSFHFLQELNVSDSSSVHRYSPEIWYFSMKSFFFLTLFCKRCEPE